MFSFCDTKITARCFDFSWRTAAEQVGRKEQRGFARGRCGHDNVQVAMETFAHRPDCTPGVLPLDQGQASASVFHSFLWAALRRQGVPQPVLRGLQGLLKRRDGAGRHRGRPWHPAWVCPASGSAWAILYEQVIRPLRRLAARVSSIVLGAFADDVRLACSEVVSIAPLIGALAPRMTDSTALSTGIAFC